MALCMSWLRGMYAGLTEFCTARLSSSGRPSTRSFALYRLSQSSHASRRSPCGLFIACDQEHTARLS